MYTYTKEALQNLGIYELRSVARQIGVYSPSTLKKEALIEKVLLIINGKEEPYVRVHKQGRPAKNISNIDEMLNIFVPNSLNVDNKPYKKTDLSKFDTKFMQENMEKIPEGKSAFKGYFKPQDTNFGIVYKLGYYNGENKDNYFIPQKLASLYQLKLGDYIEGLYSELGEDKPLIVTNIKTINGVYTETIQDRLSFEELPAIYPNKQIKFGSSKLIDFSVADKIAPIGLGSRSKINFNNELLKFDYVAEILNQISLTNNIKTIAISIDDRPEYLNELKSVAHGVEFVYNQSNLEIEQFVEQIDLKVNNAIRMVENGDNYVLVILNTNKLLQLYKSYYLLNSKNNEQQALIFANDKLKGILMLAKNTEKKLSLTILAMDCKDVKFTDMFNNFLEFNELPYEHTDIYLNLKNSFTIRANKMLSSSSFEALTTFGNSLKQNDEISLVKKLEILFNLK